MDKLEELLKDINERKELLKDLYKDHWLYDKQKDILDSKIKEYEFLSKEKSKYD